jgi:hypothetical protein
MSTDETPTPHSPPECAACGMAIGVYEPLIQVRGKLVRRTSRGAEPEACGSAGACYHAGCYDHEQLVI